MAKISLLSHETYIWTCFSLREIRKVGKIPTLKRWKSILRLIRAKKKRRDRRRDVTGHGFWIEKGENNFTRSSLQGSYVRMYVRLSVFSRFSILSPRKCNANVMKIQRETTFSQRGNVYLLGMREIPTQHSSLMYEFAMSPYRGGWMDGWNS